MKELEVSSYKDNVIASKGKVVLANLADYLVTLVLTLLLYFVAITPIFSSLNIVSSYKNDVNASQTSLKEIVNETHLQTFKGDGKTLKSTDEVANEYLETYAKTSFFVNDEKYPYKDEKGNITAKDVNKDETFLAPSFLNDPLAYYFFVYKQNEESLSSYVYEGKDYKDDKESAFFETISLFNKKGFDNLFVKKSDEISIYRQIDIEKARYLSDYLVYGQSSSSSKEVVSLLTSSFNNAENIFISEVENNLPRYIEINNRFLSAYQALNTGYVLCYFIAFIVAFPITEFLLPLFIKKHRTLGVYCFKLGYSRLDDMEPKTKNLLLKGLVRFFIQLSCVFIGSFFFNTQSIFFLSYNGFSFLYIIIFSLLLGISSIIFTLCNKRHQGFAELASFVILKDPSEFESRVQEKGEENGKQS